MSLTSDLATSLKPQRAARVIPEVSLRAWIMRRLYRSFGRVAVALLTRTTVIGRENIPEGPALLAGNHFSSYDAPVIIMHYPFGIQSVGFADFRKSWKAKFLYDSVDAIPIHRTSVDRKAMNAMIDVLKRGGKLALYPEGGSWEKGFYDVKDGVAYLSMVTGVPIVPIAVNGTYDVWRRVCRLQRPRITIEFGEPLPPVASADRKTRRQELQQASEDLMHTIYGMLDDDDLIHYATIERQCFTGRLEIQAGKRGAAPLAGELAEAADQRFDVLAELFSKQNMFTPFHEHERLPMKPFLKARFFKAADFKVSVDALYEALNGRFKGFLTYRIGEDKEERGRVEIETLKRLADLAVEHDLKLRFTSEVWLTEPVPSADEIRAQMGLPARTDGAQLSG
ncbi:MAG: 1-acyl-sn-glycerol-3-phosphate acyltransferase [Chloroflexi bacterium]|nr:1-acyl-sn-glycerol-3-phosphate acyltransferase [Chloroflexota bacterium]